MGLWGASFFGCLAKWVNLVERAMCSCPYPRILVLKQCCQGRSRLTSAGSKVDEAQGSALADAGISIAEVQCQCRNCRLWRRMDLAEHCASQEAYGRIDVRC